MDQYRRGELVFDVIDEGAADGPVVLLWHGFPQFNTSWNDVIRRLTAQGYRCVAPNQRGYSRGARPTRRGDYRGPELVEDIRALIDARGAQRVHLVGHDWGGLVAWFVAAEIPERLASLSTLSTPHPAASLTAMATSRQACASWYVYFFQLPGIPERVLSGRRQTGTGLAKLVQSGGRTPGAANRDARAMVESDALTTAIHCYRALPLTDMRRFLRKTALPTRHVWSDGDADVLAKGARTTGRYVTGEYRFKTLHGVSHWMLEEQPDVVADLLFEWFAAHPI